MYWLGTFSPVTGLIFFALILHRASRSGILVWPATLFSAIKRIVDSVPAIIKNRIKDGITRHKILKYNNLNHADV